MTHGISYGGLALPRIICAIDGALTSSGITIGDETSISWMGKLCTDAANPLPRRLWEIYMYFHGLLQQHSVTEVAFESKFFDPKRDPQGALNLGRVDGAIMMAAESLGIPCVWYSPGAIKKIATGKGNAKKEVVQASMSAMFKDDQIVKDATPAMALNPKTGRMNKNKVDDLWDSLAIWYTHINTKQ
jgi:Holliday junction resolvasome RuvABC endonuclease subunit